jgi:xylulokinase
VETYAEAGVPVARAVAGGGGVRNRVWLQATADATGLDLHLRRVATGAAYGDAFLAALALGAAEPADIERWNPVAETVRARRVEAYERQYPLFRRLYERTADLMADLGAEP